jgi:D-glycero-D-manno-heptose 1,7-bisphosphate phosphatase
MNTLKLIEQNLRGPYVWVSNSIETKKELPLVVFDRDNTLIVDAGQNNRIENLEFLPGAIDSLKICFEFGFGVAIATNQAGISKGLFDLYTLNLFHQELNSRIVLETGHSLLAIAACPHQPTDFCNCRKPKPGMFEALKSTGLEELKVFFGDSDSDLAAAQSAGLVGIQIKNLKPFDEIRKWVSQHALS